MTIRVDKCKTFGIKKTVTRSVQFKPKLFLVREQVSTVDMDKSFKYLGRWYNFEMDNAKHKAIIIQLTNDILMKIDSLPLHPRNKILLYLRYLHAKLSWDLTVADIDKTWIVNSIDNICKQFIRRWFEIPPSGTFGLILLPREKFGLEVAHVSTKLQQCQVTVRKCLRSSPNVDIQQLADMADAKTKQYDRFRASKEEIGKGQIWDSYDHFSAIANLGHRSLCNLVIIPKFTTCKLRRKRTAMVNHQCLVFINY